MKIFIGSSSEAADKRNPDKNILLKIAKILRDAGAEPVPWNKVPSIFTLSNATIEDLEKIVKKESIEASVFIYSEDDLTWYRNETVKVPRDNVVFEHGLFTGILGRGKVITVKVGNAKIPSDLYGIKYINYSDSPESVQLEIMAWVSKLIGNNDYKEKVSISGDQPVPGKKNESIELIFFPQGKYNRIKDNQKISIDKPFSISKNLITQSIYASIMEKNPSFFQGDCLPVESITFLDAVIFCNKLSMKEGYQEVYIINNDEILHNEEATGYRLPFETEWEYVLGYNDKDIQKNLNVIAWYSDNSEGKTHEVGQKNENSFGIYDLLGNVWEWCFDHQDNSKLRTLRGGSFVDFKAQFTTQGFRKEQNENLKSKNVGIRIVLQNPSRTD